MKKSPLCVITGLGEGTGGHTAKRFANAGYRIAMLARTKERLTVYERELKGSKGYECDVSKLDLLKETCERIKKEMGHPQILIHNAVKGNFEKLLEGKPEWLEENFRINTTSLMYLVHAFIPNMVKSKKGVIIVTGNTAAKTVGLTSSIDDIYANRLEGMLETKLASKRKFQTLEESVGKAISEEEFDALAEKQDACYHKVKSRYKVWPSAYASGALVQCRKKGAKNWGNKSK